MDFLLDELMKPSVGAVKLYSRTRYMETGRLFMDVDGDSGVIWYQVGDIPFLEADVLSVDHDRSTIVLAWG